ncbi:MAG: polyprenyl diphosphate synthase [Candidatus Thermoplasmatota archaeon]|nr:polyprenyl diphosphate synthase [Candidatus Thermoplasmatota archaeon]
MKTLVLQNPVPDHVAIIMDGNRRYAEEEGRPSIDGHLMGRDKLEDVLEWCVDLGIRILTVYAFSTENFKRSRTEVDTLMGLFEENFVKIARDDRIKKNRIKVTVLGQKEMLSASLRAAIEEAESSSRDHDRYFFNLAIAYGGREELITAIRRIAKDSLEHRIDPEQIDENTVSNYLYTAQFPDPDLVLRTSGEVRISNFLLWQLAYSELYFTDIYWPGLTFFEFLRAVRSYQLRKRRYGK